MENKGPSIASCASMVVGLKGTEGIPVFYENQAVMAYGWNGKPFGFNGRAGGWVGNCSRA
jgi:hypothetical protein